MVQNCKQIINKVFFGKQLIYDSMIAPSFDIVNFSNFLWINIGCNKAIVKGTL